jgi:hypothetical protein
MKHFRKFNDYICADKSTMNNVEDWNTRIRCYFMTLALFGNGYTASLSRLIVCLEPILCGTFGGKSSYSHWLWVWITKLSQQFMHLT